MSEESRIFHARFGRFEDGKKLVFGNLIDIPYTTDQFSLAEMDENAVVNLHARIADGIYALAIAGMDDNGIQIFQDKGDKGARFEIANFSWSETPIYLHLRARKLVLEITHDSRTQVDKQNEEYRKLNPEPSLTDQKPEKVYILPLHKGQQFRIID